MGNEILPFPPFTLLVVLFPFGGIPRQTSSELRSSGAELCEFGFSLVSRSIRKPTRNFPCRFSYGAGNEIRTRDVYLGKVTLYH